VGAAPTGRGSAEGDLPWDPTDGKRLSRYSFTMLPMTTAAEPMRKRSKRIVSVGWVTG